MRPLPTMTNIKKGKKQIIEFAGLNRNTLIADNELSACSNLSTDNFPLVSPRKSREATQTLSGTGYALTSTDELAWVDGTDFKYNGTTKGTVTAGAKCLVDFQGKILIFPDKKYYDYENDEFGVMQGYIPFVSGEYNAEGIYTTSKTKIATIYPILLNAADAVTTYTITHDKTGVTSGKAYIYDESRVLLDDITLSFSNVSGVMTETIDVVDLPEGYATMNIHLSTTDLTIKFQIAETVYPSAGKVPDIDYATVWNGRIWAVKGTEIFSSSLGNMHDWTTFIDIVGAVDEGGAYQNKDLYTNGDFTGITTYANHVYFFKEKHMFQLFGDVPSNFAPIEVSKTGCIDNNSIKEVKSALYFLGSDGIYQFTGGRPEVISYPLNESYVSGVAGGDLRRYYISLYNGTGYKLYAFDTWHDKWLQEDTLQVKGFTFFEGHIYALANDNKIYKFDSGSETVTSSFETKVFTDNMMEKKGHSKINVRVDLETDSEMKIYTKIDNGTYTLVKTYSVANMQQLRVPILINRADHFQLKFEFTGEYVLHAIERVLYVGSDV